MIDPLMLPYLDEELRVSQWPGKKHIAVHALILAYLVSKFEVGRTYTEIEVTEILKQWHTFDDWAMLRREMFERGLMNREKNGSLYWRTPTTNLY